MSLSARRAWIEIDSAVDSASGTLVALRKESVDRNSVPFRPASHLSIVALRKESVDRNNTVQIEIVKMHAVALRKESVDRNHVRDSTSTLPSMSLSARRAWIEMPDRTHRQGLFPRRSPQGERG